MKINYFLFWGMFGLMIELCFTAVVDFFFKKNINLKGHTSLLMFPIYAIGLTYGFDIVKGLISIDILRYLSYPFCIWFVEICIGYPASKIGLRIWDCNYLPKKYHWQGVISFIHFPVWIIFGILVEVVKKAL